MQPWSVRFTDVLLFPGVVKGVALPVVQEACVVTTGGKIYYAGPADGAPEKLPGEREIKGRGRLLMPAFTNAHAHSAMTLFRGAGADLPLQEWLFDTIFPLEARLDAKAAQAGLSLAMLEYLACGVTTVNDMYMFPQQTAKVFGENGLRALICDACVDFGKGEQQLQNALSFFHEYHESFDGRIRASISPHAEYTSNPGLIKKLVTATEQLDNVVHVHLSETSREVADCHKRHGKSPVQYFHDLSLFDKPTIAAHCVAVDENDLRLLATSGVTVSLNPISNLKLGSGVAPVPALQTAGIPLALGTDGAASNDNLDLVEEIKLTAILHKGISGNSTLVSPAQVLEMATIGGASAMGFLDVGLVIPGFSADLILVDLDAVNMSPRHDLCAALVYALGSRNITLTMASGRVLYEQGEYPTLDKERIVKTAIEATKLLALEGCCK